MRQREQLGENIPEGSRPKFLGFGGRAAKGFGSKQKNYAYGVNRARENARRVRQRIRNERSRLEKGLVLIDGRKARIGDLTLKGVHGS